MRIPFKFSESKQTFSGGFGEMQFTSGPPGKSAYDVAVQEGFDGTKGEWLESLRGKAGNGIKSAALNSDYTLTLTFTDGTSYTTPSIRGATGESGKDGRNGKDGVDGYTPVRGQDYYTPADKAEMVAAVIAALPIYDGEVIEE